MTKINKHLLQLGISPDNQYFNYRDEEPEDFEGYGFNSGELFNFDKTFVQFLYTRLKRFKEECEGLVDLTYHTKTIFDKKWTQDRAIETICANLEIVMVLQEKLDEYSLSEIGDKIIMEACKDLLNESMQIFIAFLGHWWW